MNSESSQMRSHSRNNVENRMISCLDLMVYWGTARRVTWVMMPTFPNDNNAALKSCGFSTDEHVINWPSELATTKETTCCDTRPWYGDRPCVPVEMSPAIDWSLMEPKFWIANLCFFKYSFNWKMRIPASTVKSTNLTSGPLSPGPKNSFSSKTRSNLSKLHNHSDVMVKSEGEWPDPTVMMVFL